MTHSDLSHPASSATEVYALTRLGQEQLQGGKTSLSTAQLQLLIRFDGVLTVAQIRSGMPGVPGNAFAAMLRSLREGGWVRVVEPDFFQSQLQEQLDSFSIATDGPSANASMASLSKSGYFVEIARGSAARRKPRAAGQAITAVVIEDEPILARFVKTYLALEGIQARLAANRAQVVAELNAPPVPDVVLLDVMLPDADGFDILLRLRQHPVFKDVPVIMLTGQATREAVLRGIGGGADGYVTKPFQADSLIRAVRTVLDLPHAAAQADPWANGDAAVCRKWQVQPAAAAR